MKDGASGADHYELVDGLIVEIVGAATARAHFRAEYGRTFRAAGNDRSRDVAVRAEFASDGAAEETVVVAGGHKTVRWRVAIAPADARPVQARIHVSGRPRTFGLSIVQGYFVEPLVSVAAAERGRVLVPCAAVVVGGEAVAIIGRSRAGKSSVCARALASGAAVLGDDQVFVDASGQCSPFPRRMRFYSDLPATAPRAYEALPARTRSALKARKLARAVTRGFVAPPVRVDVGVFGVAPPGPLPLSRALIVERTDRHAVSASGGRAADAVADALALLDEQRARIRAAMDSEWARKLAATRAEEQMILRDAFASVEVRRIGIPIAWDAPRAIDALAGEVGLAGIART